MTLLGASLLTGTLVARASKLHANNNIPRKVCILILVASAQLTARRHFIVYLAADIRLLDNQSNGLCAMTVKHPATKRV